MSNMKPLSIIGVPMHAGQPKKGVEFGPEEMRKFGLTDRLQRLGVQFEDKGNLDLPNPENDENQFNIKNPKAVGGGCKIISEAVEKELKKGNRVLVLGGDHSLGIGSVHGHIKGKKEPPIVIWIDAHSDINTSTTTESGNAHGMPVSFFLEETRSTVPNIKEFDWISGSIKGKDVVFIGLRDVDMGEVKTLEKYGIKHFSMHEVDKYGIKTVLQMALDMTDPTGKRPIHVSFDIDGMDPMFTPSTGTAVPGGLTLRECLYMAEVLHATGQQENKFLREINISREFINIKNTDYYTFGPPYLRKARVACDIEIENRVSVIDVVELNVKLGSDEDKKKTVMSTLKVVEHFFGNKRAGFAKPE